MFPLVFVGIVLQRIYLHSRRPEALRWGGQRETEWRCFCPGCLAVLRDAPGQEPDGFLLRCKECAMELEAAREHLVLGVLFSGDYQRARQAAAGVNGGAVDGRSHPERGVRAFGWLERGRRVVVIDLAELPDAPPGRHLALRWLEASWLGPETADLLRLERGLDRYRRLPDSAASPRMLVAAAHLSGPGEARRRQGFRRVQLGVPVEASLRGAATGAESD